MPVLCAAMLGLLCLSTPGAAVERNNVAFSRVERFNANSYKIEHWFSDVMSGRNLAEYKHLCREVRCLRLKAAVKGCSISLEFYVPSDPGRDWNREAYYLTADGSAAMSEALSKTYVVTIEEGGTLTPLKALVKAHRCRD